MNLKIAQRLRPYSHVPGAACLIPGTLSRLRAYPTRLEIDGTVFPLPLTGPVQEFTLQQDLEKHCVFVFGRAPEGYFRLRIEGKEGSIALHSEKGPLEGDELRIQGTFVPKAPFERLSLGSHKALDWDLVQRRADPKDWLPVLFCLGQKIPPLSPQPLLGTARLLDLPKERLLLDSALENFFKAAFHEILVPRLKDDQYQGLSPDESASGHPAYLLQEGYQQIRSLFFSQNERRLAFLPRLPLSADAGRLLSIKAPGIGEIDFEWSKNLLRRVWIRPDTTGEIILELQKEIRSFRAYRKKQKATEPLLLEKGKFLYLDQFLK